jgi:hypothetical protein
MPGQSRSDPALSTLLRGQQGGRSLRAVVCSPCRAGPDRAWPCLAVPRQTAPGLAAPHRALPQLPPERAAEEAEAPCAAVAAHAVPHRTLPYLAHARQTRTDPTVLCRTSPSLAPPDLAGPNLVWSYTVTGCQHHQVATTSALNRPCLGRQSPMPTSLPASSAISAMSRWFSTSGSN